MARPSAVAAVLATAFTAPAEVGAQDGTPVAAAATAHDATAHDATALAGTLAAASTADFTLARGNGLAGYTDDLDAALTNQGVTNLMAQANRNATPGCTGPFSPDLTPAKAFCLDVDDTNSKEWIPQAVTGVSDAQLDEAWGDNDTSSAVLFGSYDDDNPGRSDTDPTACDGQTDACNEKGVRVTFLNQNNGAYRHVLLVWPYTNSAGNTSYDALHAREGLCGEDPPPAACEAQTGIHIGGMVWYGNYLYVADTYKGLRVFDMRHILDLNPDQDVSTNDPTPGGLTSDVSDKSKIGRHNNVWYSYGYRYVMPQVETWTLRAEKNSAGYCQGSGRPKVSYVSLDRTGSDHLVVGEYCNLNEGKASGGRVATWPLNGTTGEPVWYDEPDGFKAYADAAYAVPTGGTISGNANEPLWHKFQGVARFNGTWYFHRSYGFDYGRMLRATVSSGQLVMQGGQIKTSTGPEDLYVEHGRTTGRTPLIWSISEHRYVNDSDPDTCSVSTAMCKRVLYGYRVSDIDAKP